MYNNCASRYEDVPVHINCNFLCTIDDQRAKMSKTSFDSSCSGELCIMEILDYNLSLKLLRSFCQFHNANTANIL